MLPIPPRLRLQTNRIDHNSFADIVGRNGSKPQALRTPITDTHGGLVGSLSVLGSVVPSGAQHSSWVVFVANVDVGEEAGEGSGNEHARNNKDQVAGHGAGLVLAYSDEADDGGDEDEEPQDDQSDDWGGMRGTKRSVGFKGPSCVARCSARFRRRPQGRIAPPRRLEKRSRIAQAQSEPRK